MLPLLEVFFQFIVILFLITQIVLPLIFDRPLFPVFRLRWMRVRHELKETLDDAEYDKFKQKLEDVKKTDEKETPHE